MVNLMNKIQILRKISQTLFFVRALIVTGFYLSIVGFIKRFIIGDRILATIITKIIAIVLAFIAGRVFCGWMCPFGFLFNLVYELRVKLFKLKKLPTVDEKIHNKLIYFKYVVLILVVLAYLSGVKISGYTLAYLLLALFLVLGFIYPMFFCRYVCPVGSLLSIFARFSIFKLKLDENKCVGCRLCERKCPMQIKITEKIDQMECIRCFECMSVCKKGALSFSAFTKNTKKE